MFDNTPGNLPTAGKSLLDNMGSENSPSPAVNLKQSQPPTPPKTEVAPQPAPKMPAGMPGKADDMFAEIKDAPAVSAAPQANVPVKGETMVETPQKGFKKVIITVGSIVIFAGALGVGGYWAYNQFLKPKELNPNLNLNINFTNTEPVVEETVQEQPAQQEIPAPQVTAPVIVDSDNDGLIDTEEIRLGTNPNNPDTDTDRLFDGEEANVYHTDPLNKDTDGDGFEDGSEVQNGYDPKGPGKLIKIPA